jgi:uncharacterized protein
VNEIPLLGAVQRRLIYFPSQGRVPSASRVLRNGEDVVLMTEDGVRLGAWYVAPVSGDAARAVLICNGNAGDRMLRAPLAAALVRAGLSVLLFDYRGYGGNPGRPSEQGLAADARAAQSWLATRHDAGRIVYFGESLGAAVALRLAIDRPPEALILRSPFTSLADVGRARYPWLPVGQLLVDRYPSIDRISRLTARLLVIAGDRDTIVPAVLSRRLYDAAPEPKRLVIVSGADHNDPRLLDGSEMLNEINSFLREHGPPDR